MKYVALFLSAVVGGLVGAGAMYLGSSLQVGSPRADDVAEVRGELRELRERIGKLETNVVSVAPITREKPPFPSTLKEDLLEAARAAARDVATEIVRGESTESTETGTEQIRETVLSRALEQLRAPHPDTRRNGIRRLRRMFAADASAQVLPALSDESALVRREAAAFFEFLWDPAALDPLVELMYGEDASIAEQALDALCKSGEADAIAELQDYYLTGPVLELAFEAGKALEENRHASAVPDGVQRFRDALGSTDPGNRRIGVAGLRRWGTVQTDGLRVRAMASDADEGVRAEAKRTLAAWGLDSGG